MLDIKLVFVPIKASLELIHKEHKIVINSTFISGGGGGSGSGLSCGSQDWVRISLSLDDTSMSLAVNRAAAVSHRVVPVVKLLQHVIVGGGTTAGNAFKFVAKYDLASLCFYFQTFRIHSTAVLRTSA